MSLMPTRHWSFHLFRLFGIHVYLSYSWFLVVLYDIYVRGSVYTSYVWNVLECVALFSIVLAHEFGHALACRQVGGRANEIKLWPLGGAAYISPPPRPCAVLWSIAAGPLVNLALLPVFATFWLCSNLLSFPDSVPNVHTFITTLLTVDIALLIFNLLPFYPLDGGQILQSLLWFLFGRANSLMIASIFGVIGIGVFGLLALYFLFAGRSDSAVWFGVVGVFMAFNCWLGFRAAIVFSTMEKSPRRPEFACPICREPPPAGAFWRCSRCRRAFDSFLSQAVCPYCIMEYPATACPLCHNLRPIAEWRVLQTPAVPVSPQ
jgi:Zn-dependent protease